MNHYFKFTHINIYVIWLLYFFILLCISFFVRDIPGQYEIYYTIDEIIRSSKLGDPVSFLTGAIDVSKNGWFSTENQWLINLWPPGFMLLEGYIIKFFGNNVYLVVVLQVFASLIFSLVLIMLYSYIYKNINTLIAFFIPLILFAFPVSRVFLLEPTGILLGESFSIGFFLLFFLFMLKSYTYKSINYSIIGGFFLGLSAYFRSQFETILVIITIVSILYIIYYTFKYKFLSSDKKFDLRIISILFYIILIANITTFPWRIYNYIHNDRMSWVATTSLTYSNLVRTSEELINVGGGWIVSGKGNMICLINPLTCGSVEKSNSKLLIDTFLNNPILWYTIKFEPLPKYWFSELGYWTSPSIDNTIINISVNYIVILMSFFILITLYLKRNLLNIKLISLIAISIFFCYMMIFTVVHFEARYFYFPKIFIIFTFIICLNSYLKRVNDE